MRVSELIEELQRFPQTNEIELNLPSLTFVGDGSFDLNDLTLEIDRVHKANGVVYLELVT